MKKLNLLLLFIIGTTGFSAAQSAGDNSNQETWTLLKETPEVHIYSRISQCYGQNVAFLKFENTSLSEVNITWRRPTTVLISSTEPEVSNEFSLNLTANQVIQGVCSLNNSPGLKMILVTTGMPELDFEIVVKSK